MVEIVIPEPRRPGLGLWLAIWNTVKLPVQILLFGLVVLLLLKLTEAAALPALRGFDLAGLKGQTAALITAVLVFAVGLGFVVFLWWLVSRFFSLMHSSTLSEANLAALRDLPMGLPDGTIRAVLALIVATVGLPLLLFSDILQLKESTAGYLNGIIIGVFSFYFGSKVAGVPATAMRQIANSEERAQASDQKAQAAENRAAASNAQADASARDAGDATRAGILADHQNTLLKHAQLASALLKDIVPLLPAGVLPQAAIDGLGRAEALIGLLGGPGKSGPGKAGAGQAELDSIGDLGKALLGSAETGASPLRALLQAAAPMLGGLAIPGLGPVAALAGLLSVGFRLGSAAFIRWRARVLAVPLTGGLVDFGPVTPDELRAAMDRSPLFHAAFADHADQGALATDLLDMLQRPDATDRLFARFGPDSAAPAFASQEAMNAALAELNQTMLAARAASDVPASLPGEITAKLAGAIADLRLPPGALASPAHVEALMNAANQASTAGTQPEAARAAFDALITLVGVARQKNIDLPSVLAELRQ